MTIRLLLAVAALNFGATALQAQSRDDLVRDIQRLSHDIDDEVGSSDSSTLRLSEARDVLIRAQDLINSDGGGGDLICEPYSSGNAYVVNTRTNQRLGDYTAMDTCRSIINVADNGYVCAPYSSGYAYLTDIDSNQRLGDYTTVASCQDTIRNASRDLICQPYSSLYAYVTRRSDGARLGNFATMSVCFQATSTATESYVCAPYGDRYAYLTVISTQSHIGDYQTFSNCVRNLP